MSSSAKNNAAQLPLVRRAYTPEGNAPRVAPGNMGSAVQKPAEQTPRPSPVPAKSSQSKD